MKSLLTFPYQNPRQRHRPTPSARPLRRPRYPVSSQDRSRRLRRLWEGYCRRLGGESRWGGPFAEVRQVPEGNVLQQAMPEGRLEGSQALLRGEWCLE